MFENERKYFVENVIPSYQEYFDHRESNKWGENQLLRKGINAANSLFHFREHLPNTIRPSKNNLKAQYPDYGLLADIANAAKHKNISNDNPRLSSASQVYEVLVSTLFFDEQGEYTCPQLEVFAKLDNGSEINFTNLLYNVMFMWQGNLRTWGIVDMKPFPAINANQIISRNDAEKRRADLQIIQGEAYHWNFRIQKYDYDKNLVEPVDLTGAQIQFRIIKPPTQIPIHFSIPGSRIELDFNVPLSAEQAEQYSLLPNADKKSTFLKSIMESDLEIQKTIQNALRKAIHENNKST